MANEAKEYRRGYNSSKKYYSKFRSFKKDSQGRIIGNKIGGSTEVIGKIDRSIKGFYGGWAKAQREIIKSKLIKPKTRTSQRAIQTFKPFRGMF